MKSVYNRGFLLWVVGLLQPVSAFEIGRYLAIVLDEAGKLPSTEKIQKLCMEQEKERCIIRVNRDPDLFSLTAHGNHFLSRPRRLSRDKFRLFLLKNSRQGRISRSCEDTASKLGGAAPSADERNILKGREANKVGLSFPQGQFYWPRFSKQLIEETGQSQTSHDIPHLPLLSFNTSSQLAIASGQGENQLQLDFHTLGLMLGVSPRLISQIFSNPERHYREFPLSKKGGGERIISSPRTFLKVIQQFLADFYFSGLPVHESVHSYRAERSIISNANSHVGKAYVGNVDITDYFGSVTEEYVKNILLGSGFGDRAAWVLARLCTLNGVLPQGAPTSPALSNAFLFKFDEAMSEFCVAKGMAYTRYADDISISGEDRSVIEAAIGFARKELDQSFGLKLNEEKTRIASAHGQQRVTGVVVNDAPRPPRKFRREVRAAFNNAAKEDVISKDLIRQLYGYLSYLMSFDTLKETKEIGCYQAELKELRKRVDDSEEKSAPVEPSH